MKEVLPIEEACQKFEEYLQCKKLKKTPERFAILNCLYSNEGHYDVEMLYTFLKTECRVSKATIYNNLQLLLDSHLVTRIVLDNQTAYYERATLKPHHHIICRKCGRITNLQDQGLINMLRTWQTKNFRTEVATLILYGKCKRCKQIK